MTRPVPHIAPLHPREVADFRRLIGIFQTVFENADEIPGDEYLEKLLLTPDFHVFVVRVGGGVVGGLTLYVLHRYYRAGRVAFLYDVGIDPAFQGQGLGKALLAEVCHFCRTNGIDEAFVEAEGDDSDAISFYRKTQPHAEIHAVQFSYYL